MTTEPHAIPRIPAIDGLPWHITSYPDLGELANGDEHEVVDHAIWQSGDGKWQCWACVRKTRIGRLLYGWEGDSLEQANWKPAGITMRAEQKYGESINDWLGEEFIQAPYVLKFNGIYWMFYGGHNTELGECQICLATSTDGRKFERVQNEQGYSRLFRWPWRNFAIRWSCALAINGSAITPGTIRAGESLAKFTRARRRTSCIGPIIAGYRTAVLPAAVDCGALSAPSSFSKMGIITCSEPANTTHPRARMFIDRKIRLILASTMTASWWRH